MVWPLIGAAVGLIQGGKDKREQRAAILEQQERARQQLYQDLLTSRAEELGADTREIRAHQRMSDIDRMSERMPEAGLRLDQAYNLIGQVGGALGGGSEDIDDRIAKEMAARGYMRGYQPF